MFIYITVMRKRAKYDLKYEVQPNTQVQACGGVDTRAHVINRCAPENNCNSV